MPTLANVQGSSLVPNFTGATNTLLQAFGTKQTRDAQARAEAQQELANQRQLEIEQAAADFATGDPSQKNAALGRIIARDAKIGKAFLDLRDSGTEAQQAAAIAEAEKGLRLGVKLKRMKTPQAQRKELGRMADIEAAEGRPLQPIMDLMNLPDAELGLAIQDKIDLGTDIGDLAKSATPGVGPSTKGRGVIIRRGDKLFRSIPVLQGGKVTEVETEIRGELVSGLGQTPGEQVVTAVEKAGGTAQATADVAVETAAPLAQQKVRGTGQETRVQKDISRGLTGVEALPNINETLDLLQIVGTGTPEDFIRTSQQVLGIPDADEEVLNARLGTIMISQLKTMFGGNPSEAEGRLLKDFTANFGKSPEANKRLIGGMKRAIKRNLEDGLAAAKQSGDFAATRKIQRALDEGFTTKKKTTKFKADSQGNIIQ